MTTEEKPDTTLAVDLAAAGLSTVGIGATEGGEAWFIEIQSDYEKQAKSLKQASFNASQSSSAEGDDTVPAELALSFRESANMLKFAMTQRSGRNSPGIKRPSRMGFGEMKLEEPVVEVDEEATDEELFSAMQGQWVEVECLLRVQLRSEEALEKAKLRVSESLAFDGSLGKRAAASGKLKGTVFQALLAKADGSAGATSASVGLTECSEEDWDGLAKGADALRKLVRIKVQDDNDLKAANGALTSCAEFFATLAIYGKRKRLDGMGVITALEANL